MRRFGSIFSNFFVQIQTGSVLEERGHFNENLHSWMGAWRLYTLATMKQEDLDLLWEG